MNLVVVKDGPRARFIGIVGRTAIVQSESGNRLKLAVDGMYRATYLTKDEVMPFDVPSDEIRREKGAS